LLTTRYECAAILRSRLLVPPRRPHRGRPRRLRRALGRGACRRRHRHARRPRRLRHRRDRRSRQGVGRVPDLPRR